MTGPSPARDAGRVDAEQLRLLAVFHFVVAGLALVGTSFLGLHYLFMRAFLFAPEAWKGARGGGPPPEVMFALFRWFYLVFGVLLVLSALSNALSGLCILRRRHRMFSVVVAVLDCVQVPFGTLLGVFTLVVLLRDSVMETYGS